MKNEKYVKIFQTIGIMLLIIFTMLSSSAFCNNDDVTYDDDSEYYENEEGEEFVDDIEDSYESFQNDDLEEMQKKINKLTNNSSGKASQIINQIKNGNLEGLRDQMAKDDSSFSSPVYWFFMIFISVVGMGFFWSGKRSGNMGFLFSGAIMSIFPYFVTNMWIFIPLSVVLIVLPFFLRRF